MFMTSFAVALAFSLGTEALVPRADTCCFHLTSSGGVTGGVGQLSDGQNRILGNFPQGTYCINSQGAITDGLGRGCILTPPTTQFQCDVGAQPTTGFSVNHEGNLAYNGNTEFWACATGDRGSYNIYTKPADTICVKITLAADNCRPSSSPPPSTNPPPANPPPSNPPAANPPPSNSPPSNSPPSNPPPSSQSKQCPTNLSGPYEFPHLIVPVDSSMPDKAYGTTYSPTISSTFSSIFNFDIPFDNARKTCTLVFLLPKLSDLATSSFQLSGSGAVDVSQLSGNADAGTTFKNAPSVKTDFGVTTVVPGNSYAITSFDCPQGQRITFKVSSSGGTSLHYFQDFNPPPIGLFITKC